MQERLVVHKRRAADATVEALLAADGYLFCCPENLASASGAMLEFFHSSYYHAFVSSGAPEHTETSLLLGRPYGLAIAAGSDGSNAARQVERICTGWRLRPVAPTFVHQNGLPQHRESILAPKGLLEPPARERCVELGGLVAATVLLRGAEDAAT